VTSWSFLTNHAGVLLCIAHDPGVRLCDIAASLDIAERSTYGIVTDLTEASYVVKQKDGRRNRNQIQAHLPLPEPASQEPAIGEVLALPRGRRRETAADPDRTSLRTPQLSMHACMHPGRRQAPSSVTASSDRKSAMDPDIMPVCGRYLGGSSRRLASVAGGCRVAFLSGRVVCVDRKIGLSGVRIRMCAGVGCVAPFRRPVVVSAGGDGGRAGLLAGRR
jgi:hypothetical protein